MARGSTVYVTLEPCDHVGKTPPCTRALIDAGVSRVVFAVRDPNPVAAGGSARLAAAGIEVASGVNEREARDLNAPFLFAVRDESRPFVTLKLALSIDGALVDATRTRAWLTGPEARRAVHMLRAQADVKRREVMRQQAGSGGGQNRASEDLSNLFDKELARQQQTN